MASENKMHLVKWSIDSREISKGDLGIRSLSSLNKALLGKWCWKYSLEGETFWKRSFEESMEKMRGLVFLQSEWRVWGLGMEKLQKNIEFDWQETSFEVRNGKRVKLYVVRWWTLMWLFSTLVYLSIIKRSLEGGSFGWSRWGGPLRILMLLDTGMIGS